MPAPTRRCWCAAQGRRSGECKSGPQRALRLASPRQVRDAMGGVPLRERRSGYSLDSVFLDPAGASGLNSGQRLAPSLLKDIRSWRQCGNFKVPEALSANRLLIATSMSQFQLPHPFFVLYATWYVAKLGSWLLGPYMQIKVTPYPNLDDMLEDM
ncbi:hypothetical protein C8J57DRAFT_1487644 [Mycena rebaudengoi]|nr:hypothetical protein C8J57DRAFT_1487644 [Mycena rebaudengoi]